jgi:hypothetical protein
MFRSELSWFSCVFHMLFMCFMNELILLHTSSSCPFWQRGKTHRGQSRSCSSDCTIQIYTDQKHYISVIFYTSLYHFTKFTTSSQFLACRDLAGRFMPNCLRSFCCPLVHSKYTFKRLALRLPKGCPWISHRNSSYRRVTWAGHFRLLDHVGMLQWRVWTNIPLDIYSLLSP